MNCTHPEKRFLRVLFEGGEKDGYHVGEFCCVCGENVRGSGRWVPRAELLALKIDPASLDIMRKPTHHRTDEPTLPFGDGA